MDSRISAILFDLGGVLVELNHSADNVPWFDNRRSSAENWHQWLTSPLSQEFERGLLSPTQFARQYIRDSNIQMDPERFLQYFESWVVGFYPGALTLLKQLSSHYPIGVFSNVTAVHWPSLHRQMQHHGAVKYYFASYQLGLAKPDPASFEHVAAAMGFNPGAILFLDDNPINVEGARSSGFVAENVSRFVEIPDILKRYGIMLESQ
ncbi:MAG: HAD family hydrolase [bacterium]